jgi:hypothetical protein
MDSQTKREIWLLAIGTIMIEAPFLAVAAFAFAGHWAGGDFLNQPRLPLPLAGFLRVARGVGTIEPVHSLLLLRDSPGSETNVISVCTSNISTLALSSQILAGSTASLMPTVARTSFGGCDADAEVDSPRLQLYGRRIADQGAIGAKKTYLHWAWGSTNIGHNGAHTLIFSNGQGCKADHLDRAGDRQGVAGWTNKDQSRK